MRRAWVLSPCPSVVLIPCGDPVRQMAEPYSRRIKASAIQALALSYLPTCVGPPHPATSRSRSRMASSAGQNLYCGISAARIHRMS